MKLRVVLLGLLAFALALLVVLPARWVGGLMPAAVKCAQWRGTLWNGRCQQLQVIVPGAPPIAIESAGWKLHPAALLRLRFSADVALTDSRGDATGSIELARNGQLSLRGASARALLDKQIFPVLPTGWNGRIEVQDLDFDWFDRMPRKVRGNCASSTCAMAMGASWAITASPSRPWMGRRSAARWWTTVAPTS